VVPAGWPVGMSGREVIPGGRWTIRRHDKMRVKRQKRGWKLRIRRDGSE